VQKQTLAIAALAAALGLALGYFAAAPVVRVPIEKPTHKEKNCKGKECKVDIVVKCNPPSPPTPETCESFAEDAEVIIVDSTTKPLEFMIKTGSFDFVAADGIAFSTLNAGDTHFDCKPDPGNPKKKYICTPKDLTVPSLYKYSIDIDQAGKTDPWVVNY
jgi:hypothetical protein